MSNDADNTVVILAGRPDGLPTVNDFEVERRPLGSPAPGFIRCKTLYLSLDPYMRSVIAGNHMGHGVDPGDVIAGEAVARICESDDPQWPVGSLVRCQCVSLSDKGMETLWAPASMAASQPRKFGTRTATTRSE